MRFLEGRIPQNLSGRGRRNRSNRKGKDVDGTKDGMKDVGAGGCQPCTEGDTLIKAVS